MLPASDPYRSLTTASPSPVVSVEWRITLRTWPASMLSGPLSSITSCVPSAVKRTRQTPGSRSV